MSTKVLVADVPQMDGRYSAALAGWQLAFVRTMSEARQALAAERHDPARFDLLIAGVYFDDSQMFDLVRMVRADEAHAEVPIVCVRGRSGFTALTGRTLEVTVKALGGDEFIDLPHYGDEAAANAALRALAERLLRP